MVKDHSESEKKPAFFTIPGYQLGIFYMYHPEDRISHTTAFGIPVVEYWMK